MRMSQNVGFFIALDGPKHSGKSTLLALLTPLLHAMDIHAFLTKEPSIHFHLENEEAYSGEDLARLLANDRRRHLDEVILPALHAYDVVISDRYIASSLGFQVLDGVPFETVWAMNNQFLLPDLNVFLVADEEILKQRRAGRGMYTRIERSSNVADEILLYGKISDFLSHLGVDTITIENNDSTSQFETAQRLAVAIAKRISEHNE